METEWHSHLQVALMAFTALLDIDINILQSFQQPILFPTLCLLHLCFAIYFLSSRRCTCSNALRRASRCCLFAFCWRFNPSSRKVPKKPISSLRFSLLKDQNILKCSRCSLARFWQLIGNAVKVALQNF